MAYLPLVMAYSPFVINVCQDAWPWEDGYNFGTAMFRVGEIYMTTVQDMVDNVIAHAGTREIDRLNLWDHGSRNSFQVGDDRVTIGNFAQFEPQFRRLRGHFAEEGFLHLCQCWVGQNRTLLLSLAAAIERPVYGGTEIHRAGGWNDGDYVRADPDGTFHRDVGRPRATMSP